MDLGRIRRDWGFRGGAIELSRFPDACGCLERQTRKRGAHSDRGTRFARFLCKHGEKEREQNATRSHSLGNSDCKRHRHEADHIRSNVGSKLSKVEG
eukprot:15218420-Heterocapsa_arctica.AAC.1